MSMLAIFYLCVRVYIRRIHLSTNQVSISAISCGANCMSPYLQSLRPEDLGQLLIHERVHGIDVFSRRGR
jgi:hypothetical protein